MFGIIAGLLGLGAMGVADKLNTAQKINAYKNDSNRIARDRQYALAEIERNKKYILRMAELGCDIDFITGLYANGEASSLHWSYNTKEYMKQCNYRYDDSEKKSILAEHQQKFKQEHGVTRSQYDQAQQEGHFIIENKSENSNASELFAKRILDKVENVLFNNPDNDKCLKTITLCTNFITENAGKFADCNFIRAFEIFYLSDVGLMGKALLINNNKHYDKELINYVGAVKSYTNEAFIPFASIIEKYTDCKSNIEKTYFTYRLLMKMAIAVLGNHGKNQYGSYLQNVKELSVEDIIQVYCDIEDDCLTMCPALTYYLMLEEVIPYSNYLEAYDYLYPLVSNGLKEYEASQYEKRLLKINDDSNNVEPFLFENYTVKHTDQMTGTQFESFVAELFTRLGYSCEITKATGDQGIDIIAKKNDLNIGIQAKCYNNTVGNKAIQEAVAGKSFYNLDKVMVVTNNYFTSSAIELAQANNVPLWNRNDIDKRLKQIKELDAL